MENIFNKENCFDIIAWDYKGHNIDSIDKQAQIAWNHTLITAINQSSNTIYSNTLSKQGRFIRINNNLLPIIKSLYLYDKKTMTILGYTIVVDKSVLENEIYVYSDEIFDLKIVRVKVGTETKINSSETTFKLKLVSNLNSEELKLEKRKRMGIINILNYKK